MLRFFCTADLFQVIFKRDKMLLHRGTRTRRILRGNSGINLLMHFIYLFEHLLRAAGVMLSIFARIKLSFMLLSVWFIMMLTLFFRGSGEQPVKLRVETDISVHIVDAGRHPVQHSTKLVQILLRAALTRPCHGCRLADNAVLAHICKADIPDLQRIPAWSSAYCYFRPAR